MIHRKTSKSLFLLKIYTTKLAFYRTLDHYCTHYILYVIPHQFLNLTPTFQACVVSSSNPNQLWISFILFSIYNKNKVYFYKIVFIAIRYICLYYTMVNPLYILVLQQFNFQFLWNYMFVHIVVNTTLHTIKLFINSFDLVKVINKFLAKRFYFSW